MLAATALARRRIERQDVDTFIAAREARADVAATTRAAEVTVLMR